MQASCYKLCIVSAVEIVHSHLLQLLGCDVAFIGSDNVVTSIAVTSITKDLESEGTMKRLYKAEANDGVMSCHAGSVHTAKERRMLLKR